MTTKTIKWNTGDGNITIKYDTSIIEVTSDANNLSSLRSQTITLTSADGLTARLIVRQKASGEVTWVATYNITYFDTLQDLKDASEFLLDGDVVSTKGYYEANDGGGSTFFVKESATELTCDDATLVDLSNNLYAEIQEPLDGIINFKQFGAKSLDNNYSIGSDYNNPSVSEIKKSNLIYDCKPYMQKYLDFCDSRATTYTLMIPQGTWCFSPMEIKRTLYPDMGIDVVGFNMSDGGLLPTVIYPLRSETVVREPQEYIWKLKDSKHNRIRSVAIRGLHYSGQTMISGAAYSYGNNTAMNSNKCGTAVIGLYLDNVSFSNFDYIGSGGLEQALHINNSNNLYFGYTVYMHCGVATKENTGIITLDSNIYNVYFEYNNFEQERGGSYFYGCSEDPNSVVQFVVNNIQSETNGPTSVGDDPGFGDDLDYRWYFFDGKLGSKGRPVIVNTISVSNFKGWYNSDSYKARMVGIVGHGVNGTAGSSININTLSVLGEGRIILEDVARGGEFTINTQGDGKLILKNSNLPLMTWPKRATSYIYAVDCEPSGVSTLDGAEAPYSMVGANETSEYYSFVQIPGKTYKMRFYNETSNTSFSGITIDKLVNGTWTNITTSGSITGATSGWTEVALPDFNQTVAYKIRIKGLPKNIDYFYAS